MTVLPAGEGRSFSVGADRLTVKGTSETDAFSFIEYEAVPHMPGPPMHVHRDNEEAFYILSGEVRFTLGETTKTLTAGAFVRVPRGVAHTFVNAGETPARWVGIFSPGRYLSLVEELGELLAAGPPDPAAIGALFARYGTDIVA